MKDNNGITETQRKKWRKDAILYSIARFNLRGIGYDFLGYKVEDDTIFTYQSVILTPKQCIDLHIPEEGYSKDLRFPMGVAITEVARNYLEVIGKYEPEIYEAICMQLKEMIIIGKLDYFCICRIQDQLREFELRHKDERTPKDKPLIREEFISRRIPFITYNSIITDDLSISYMKDKKAFQQKINIQKQFVAEYKLVKNKPDFIGARSNLSRSQLAKMPFSLVHVVVPHEQCIRDNISYAGYTSSNVIPVYTSPSFFLLSEIRELDPDKYKKINDHLIAISAKKTFDQFNVDSIKSVISQFNSEHPDPVDNAVELTLEKSVSLRDNATQGLVENLRLREIGYDFMGFKVNKSSKFVFKHILLSYKKCVEYRIPDEGYYSEGHPLVGLPLTDVAVEYLGVIQKYDTEIYKNILLQLKELVILTGVECDNIEEIRKSCIMRIQTSLKSFESIYGENLLPDGSPIVRENFISDRVNVVSSIPQIEFSAKEYDVVNRNPHNNFPCIKSDMINSYGIDGNYDFMGCRLDGLSDDETFSSLTLHHIVVPRKQCYIDGLPDMGYIPSNIAPLTSPFHDMVHCIGYYEERCGNIGNNGTSLYTYVNDQLIAINIKGFIDPYNIKLMYSGIEKFIAMHANDGSTVAPDFILTKRHSFR